MTYLPIEDHGIVGDMHTAALIGKNGTVDWMCYPYFDSPSLFASTLDDEIGGSFEINPVNMNPKYRQFYWPETNVLVTRFVCGGGIGEIRDFMPLREEEGKHRSRLVRQVMVVRGSIELEVRCAPAFDYARASHDLHIEESYHAIFRTDDLKMSLSAGVELVADDGAAIARFTLQQGETETFILGAYDPNNTAFFDSDAAQSLFEKTVHYWRDWLNRCTYTGRWRDIVYRSALALKLLTFQPTGAIVAAPTMALPENIGGERNWDYRYVWIRDAAFTLYGLMRVGFTDEAEAFMGWLMERARDDNTAVGPLQPLYTIHGGTNVDETILDHLNGHKGSQPVRLGNSAYNQLQLDIYGELMDAVYLSNKYGTRISYDLWEHLRPMLDWVCDNWQQPDEGIWEVRGERSNLVYSRLMCWVALDRGLRLADKRSFPAPYEHWRQHRDAIYEEVMNEGWSDEVQAFTQSYEVDSLDASTLIMPLVFFMAPSDPRMLKTIDAILQTPKDGGLTEDSLVYRYNPEISDDGLEGGEGTFNMCTFWLVEALTRAGKHEPERLDHARLLFERMLGYANHLGLYAEETGTRDNALGNFPQAFTHLSLISAAYNLDRVLNDKP